MRQGVELRTRCRVREITLDDAGMAKGVWYYDQDGAEQFQQAAVVILATNGVGTPRLMLNSKSERFPDGLANSSGLVGKNLMFHPYAMIRGVFPEALDGHRGPGACIWSQEFYETDLSRGFVRGFTFEMNRGMGPAATAMLGLGHGRIPWGQDFHRMYARLHERVTGMVAICEDLPEPHNTVTLDDTLVDSHGIPAPKISYTLSDNSRKMLDYAVARAAEALRAGGATDIMSEAPLEVPQT